MAPLYSAQLLVSIQRTVTNERLTRYLRATRQDMPLALGLYECNVHLSEALYGILHGLEIAVRNAQDQALAASFSTPAWYEVVNFSLHWANKIAEAKTKHGQNARPGQILSDLTFGFWVDLLKNSNHRTLWIKGQLHRAFPNARQPRTFIHDRLKRIQLLRNRIAHYECVLTSSGLVYNGAACFALAEVIECIGWVCPETALWIKTRFRYTDAEQILRRVAATGITL